MQQRIIASRCISPGLCQQFEQSHAPVGVGRELTSQWEHSVCVPCRLGTAVVFVALYFKTFSKGKQAQQAPKSSPAKDPLRSPGKTPTRSPKLASTGKPQWDMEAAGKRS